ncbi:MAG: TonB-dependent receptor [Thermoanaerobaculia bacterium]
MKLNRFLVLTIGFLFVAMGALGQTTTGSLSGTVTAAGTAVPGVTVTVTSPVLTGSRTTTTNAAGSYEFAGLFAGDYAVTYELQGFETMTKHVTIGADQSATLDADLQAATGAKYGEEVTVTGSLIPRPTIESMSPVTTLDVEQLKYQGSTRVEEFLTNLPQIFTAQNSTYSNGASGTATIDLRHLGATRTLVLVNGHRMPAGDRFALSPDLNMIPGELVKRVDVLTGGASAVYGADAVAGVVNFVLDTEFEGLKAGILGGGFQHNNDSAVARQINEARGFNVPTGSVWDGGQLEAYAAYGGKFGSEKGHGMFYVDYRENQALLKDRRDYTNCSVTGLSASGPACSGSSTTPLGRFLVPDTGKSYTLDTAGPGDTFKPGYALFNFATYNYMQRPDRRWTAGGFLNYNFNSHAQGYGSVMLMDDNTDAQIAPSGNFFSTSAINCDNPMMSAQERQIICTDNGYGPTDDAPLYIGRRNVEGGARTDLLTHQSYRIVGGMKGDINKAWSYDVSGVHADTKVPETYINDLDSRRLQQALFVTGDPNDPSTWQCRDATARSEGCVPWNLFKVGGVTQAALDYIRIPLLSNTDLVTQTLDATARADLGQYGITFPTAAEGVKLALGYSFNRFSINFQPDQAYQLGIGAGQGGPTPPVVGSYHANEMFAELLLPIMQGVPGAKDLSVSLGYRTSDYSTTGRFPTYKAQVSYAPTADFKIRGGYNRATRSPNIVELFRPQGITLGGSQDICAGENPSATLEQCQRTGVTPAQYGHILDNPAEQYNTLSGGNPDLNPEIADTYTLGLVLTPRGLPNFNATFDYYNIKLKDTIGTLGADQVISACADTGDPDLCSLIHRDALGTLWLTPQGYTVATNVNIGQNKGEGVDVTSSWLKPMGSNSFNVSLIGTYMLKDYINTGLYAYDCQGYFGDQCGEPDTDWSHLMYFTYQFGPAAVTLGWRYIGQTKIDASNPAPALYAPGDLAAYKAVGSYQLPATNYFDLSANYNLMQNVSLSVGVNNIADKTPPLGAGLSFVDYAPGFAGLYDPYGRYIHGALTFHLQ